MSKTTSLLHLFTPGVPKKYLLFVAAVIWTFAGGMLLLRGINMLVLISHLLWLRTILSVTGGMVFYLFLFSKIAHKHTQRILNLQIEKPCIFSFFDFKSYLMMTSMISMGILLRKTGIVPPEYLSVFYVCMGIPLFISAFRFYYHGITNK